MKYFALVVTILVSTSCNRLTKNFNLFPIGTDLSFGAQVAAEFDQTNASIILDSTRNTQIYQYLYAVRDSILLNNAVDHEGSFPWRIRIIKDDNTLNAFCTPGGYIYFYTGILKYLESEAELAGVMGHEIAHAAKRHSTEALTRQFGIELFTQLLIDTAYHGLTQVATGLAQLKYGRGAELESDEYSVIWLNNTSYRPTGAAGFFERIQSSSQAGNPEFLSTHPDPGKRVEKMHEHHKALGNKTGNDYRERYQNMIRRYL
jgi:predicted Zn-dependent protease